MNTVVGHGAATGRLDFLGGVADYSGSLVLEMPIRGKTYVEITSLERPQFLLQSKEFGITTITVKNLRQLLIKYLDITSKSTLNKDALRKPEEEISFLKAIREHLVEIDAPSWTRYVIGCIVVFCIRKRWVFGNNNEVISSTSDVPQGLRIIVSSEVNSSMGVSSSAALEIATLRAISAYAQHSRAIVGGTQDKSLGFNGTELAHLGQLAENRIVGAPCGLMDQLSTAYGLPNHLLPILCRPDTLYDNIPIPEGIAIVGWPSGIKHSVAESPYMIARTAAFMGKKIMENLTHREVRFTTEFTPNLIRGPIVNLSDSTQTHKPATHHHSTLGPFPSCFSHLPVSMLGADFLKLYGKVDDSLSLIKPELYYPVQAAFNFPVNENFRAQLMISLLSTLSTSNFSSATSSKNNIAFTRESLLSQMGELLYQSHRDYSAMGLGCSETDKMIEILQSLRHKGVYGGRSSGGGSGGTVVVICEKDAVEIVRAECKKFPSSKSLDLIL